MVISQPPGNNPSYYYRASPTLPQLLWMSSRDNFMFYTCNYNIRVTHRNEKIKHIFYTNQIHGGIISRLFFIHFVAHALVISSGEYITKFSRMKICCHLQKHTSVGCISSRMPAGPHFVTQPILLSENILNIWHKSSTKHKEVRPDWNDKNDNKTKITWRFYQWLRLPFLKKYSIKCGKRFRLWIVLFWTKTSQRLTLYLLSSHR